MSRILTLVLMLVLVVAGCGGRMELQTLTAQDTDLKARAGVNWDGLYLHGTAVYGRSSSIEWGPDPDGLGFGFLLDATWQVDPIDTPPRAPVPVNWLENLVGIPYVGIEWVDYKENDKISNLRPQYIGGMRFAVQENVHLIAEYSDGDGAPGEAFFGLCIRR